MADSAVSARGDADFYCASTEGVGDFGGAGGGGAGFVGVSFTFLLSFFLSFYIWFVLLPGRDCFWVGFSFLFIPSSIHIYLYFSLLFPPIPNHLRL